ncbi:hypothetical protein LguiB_019870 [Lonicera macranthoides]
MDMGFHSEEHHHCNHQTPQVATATAPIGCYHSSSHLNNNNSSSFCYGENGDFHSSNLSLMPLKSDGSLYLMEALTTSQTQGIVLNSSKKKLEDFLGDSTIRETMPLSLDNIYYHQNDETESHSHHSLEFIQESFSHHQQELQQQHPYYSSMYQSSAAEEEETKEIQQLAECDDDTQTNVPMYMGNHGPGQQMNSGDLQSLNLSMSPGSRSSCVSTQISPPKGTQCYLAVETKKRGSAKAANKKQTVHRKSIDTFGQRTSQYRGVTKHRWTGRYEAHLWDNSCKKEGQTRKGRQGGYDMEEKAARAYDCAALKYWGPSTHINFSVEDYQQELEGMKNMNHQEYVAHLRRKSSGFSRGASMYRGVTRHHQHGRWQARIGRVAGNKDLYLGTFCTQEEAAEAYDIAAIKFRGTTAVTNFDMTKYNVERIISTNTLLAGDLARRNNHTEPTIQSSNQTVHSKNNVSGSDWRMVLSQSQDPRQSCYMNPSFSAALQGLTGTDSGNSSHLILDESERIGTPFSNPSSLVTSLNNSREASPERTNCLSSWISSAQLRTPTISMAHLPVFAAWSDDT